MNTLEGGKKNYQVVAGPGMQFIDLYRAAIALWPQRPDISIRPIRFTNLETPQYLVEITTSDETIVAGFRRLVEVARDLRQSPPPELPEVVLQDPEMREMVLMGYLQEEARELFQSEMLR